MIRNLAILTTLLTFLTLPPPVLADDAMDVSWVNDVFDAVDSGDVDAFVEFMTEDVLFRHGN